MSRKASVLSDSKSLKQGISPARGGVNGDVFFTFRRRWAGSPLMILQKMQADAIAAFRALFGRVDCESQSLETGCGNDVAELKLGRKAGTYIPTPHGVYFAVRFGLKG